MSQPDDVEQIDTTDSEDTEILMADPDDYHQSQRLREIHEARRNVHDIMNSIDHITGEKEHKRQQYALANAVVLYAQELLPPAHDADIDTSLPDHLPWENLETYTRLMGKNGSEQPDAPAYLLHNAVFAECNNLLAEMKPLISTEETSEWEV